MPPALEVGAIVTIETLSPDCWIIRLVKSEQDVKLVVIPRIKHLPDDPEWEKTEAALAKHATRNLPEPE